MVIDVRKFTYVELLSTLMLVVSFCVYVYAAQFNPTAALFVVSVCFVRYFMENIFLLEEIKRMDLDITELEKSIVSLKTHLMGVPVAQTHRRVLRRSTSDM